MRGGDEAGSSGGLDRILLLFLFVTLGATALAALAPVTDGDALCYHLQVPKVFLIRQAVVLRPRPARDGLSAGDRDALRGGPRVPRAGRLPAGVQWLLGLVFAANVTALARPSLGAGPGGPGPIALLVPAVTNGMAAPLNDVALAAFGTAAIVAWTRMLDRPSRQRRSAGGSVLPGWPWA